MNPQNPNLASSMVRSCYRQHQGGQDIVTASPTLLMRPETSRWGRAEGCSVVSAGRSQRTWRLTTICYSSFRGPDATFRAWTLWSRMMSPPGLPGDQRHMWCKDNKDAKHALTQTE